MGMDVNTGITGSEGHISVFSPIGIFISKGAKP